MALRKLFIQLSNVVNPQVEIAKNKYNLPFVSMFTVDDGIKAGVINSLELWEGAGFSYPDGCGNRINYASDIAVNIDHATEQNRSFFEWLVYEKNGSILNHSAYANGEDRLTQLQLIREQYRDYMKYEVSGVVVPGADMGYGDAAISHPDLFVISGRGDVFDSLNPFMWYREVPTPLSPSVPPFPQNRDVLEFDDQGLIDLLISKIDELMSDNENGDKFFPFASHDPLSDTTRANRFLELFGHIHDNYSEQSMVCSLREWNEYLLMRSVGISTELDGSTLEVTIDDSGVPQIQQTSWLDNCFNLTGATIESITHEGFDEVNFNPATGLINAHKRITVWGEPEPQQIFVKHGRFVV